MNELQINLESLEERIFNAAGRVGRDRSTIRLVAVSKKQPPELVSKYCEIKKSRGEIPLLGENYVQEWQEKSKQLSLPLIVHLIGPLQSNKTKLAVSLFDVIESVHKTSILEGINQVASEIGKRQKVLLQVNISGDSAKKGFLPEQIGEIFRIGSKLSGVQIMGLMTITKYYDFPEDARSDYSAMNRLRASLLDEFTDLIAPDTFELSMGMSGDFEVAIEEGATIIRVGSALFGERSR